MTIQALIVGDERSVMSTQGLFQLRYFIAWKLSHSKFLKFTVELLGYEEQRECEEERGDENTKFVIFKMQTMSIKAF